MTDILEETTFTRGTFLKGSGALVVGISLAGAATAGKASAAAPVRNAPGPWDPKDVDTWIAVHNDNTATIYTGRMELGQGSPTALMQIAAEELDMEWSQIRFALMDTHTSPDTGNTTGSSSIARGGPLLRAGAAEARQALLKLASANLGVPVASLSVAKGVVSGGGKSVTYGSLIGDRLFNTTFTGTAPQKKVADYKVVGQRVTRDDIPDKVSGKFTYMHNVRVDGMLHGRIVRPRGQGAFGTGAKPLSVDARSIANIPGVQLIRKGDFVGVVAPHEYAAIQAAAQLKVKWQDNPILPGNGDLFGTMKKQTTSDSVQVNTGNVDAQFASSANKVLSASYAYDYQIHGSIGPQCSIAIVKSDYADVMCSTQGAYRLRTGMAQLLGLPEGNVRIRVIEGASVFGHNPQDDVAMAAAVMSQQLGGKPVRVQLMRWDEHGWDNYGPAELNELRGAVDAKGKIVGFEYVSYLQPGTSIESTDEHTGTPIPTPGRGNADVNNTGAQYAIANRRVVGKSLPLLSGYFKSAPLRAPGALQATFASEQMVDELAFAAGIDPVAFRRQNITSDRWLGVLDAVVAAARWQPRVANSHRPSGDVVTGRGIAIGGFASSFAAVVAEIEVNRKTGKIVAKHMYAAQDAGLAINPALIENQIEGNLVQATSRSLLEQVNFTKSRVSSTDWASYPILRFKDAPAVTAIVVNRPDMASTGSGEPPSAPTPAAIANAFFDATGIRIRQNPMTPGRVRAVLKA
jgi:nicotinate dehydrogenase subunit B